MQYYEVAPNQIVRHGSDFFTYSSETPLKPGHIVRIPIGKKTVTGVVWRDVSKPNFTTKPIDAVIESTPLPEHLLHLARWLSDYYTTPLGVVLQTLLPRGLHISRRTPKKSQHTAKRDRTNIVLNEAQQQAITTVQEMTPGTAILHGVTGSGKTQVYIELAKKQLAEGRSTIVLVPEIALTSQLVAEFSHHFDDIILIHSKQTEAKRHNVWKQALESSRPIVAIGPRSALFSPLPNIGLIVIDEAHEPSFKQEQAPRYSALRAASVLAQLHKASLILGSATPSVNDYYLAKHSNRPIVSMPNPARPGTKPPYIINIDMTKRTHFKSHRFISDKLLESITSTLESGAQVLIFHNRRGSASTTLCENCGWSAICEHCFVPFTLHTDTHHLRCHLCGRTERVPTSCPDCGAADIIHKGIGTKLIESELKKIFPNKIIARFDGDSSVEESLETRYDDLYNGTIDIIIGTQVIAKGLDLPHLRTVGIIQADSGLSLPDYGSSERTFQLLAQAIGRVGRSDNQTQVIVQTYQPSHPAITYGISQDYLGFYEHTLKERSRASFPPFTFLLKLTCVYKTEAAAIKNAKLLASTLRNQLPATVEILGPTPAFYERQANTYRWQLLLKSAKRGDLVTAMNHVPSTHWQSELDPISLL